MRDTRVTRAPKDDAIVLNSTCASAVSLLAPDPVLHDTSRQAHCAGCVAVGLGCMPGKELHQLQSGCHATLEVTADSNPSTCVQLSAGSDSQALQGSLLACMRVELGSSSM